MTCRPNTISFASRLIQKCFRRKCLDLFAYVCSLNIHYSVDSFWFLCCIMPCESSGRFLWATRYKCAFLAICQSKIRTSQELYDKDKDQIHKDKDKDLKLVLKESLRTRTRINITDLHHTRRLVPCRCAPVLVRWFTMSTEINDFCHPSPAITSVKTHHHTCIARTVWYWGGRIAIVRKFLN